MDKDSSRKTRLLVIDDNSGDVRLLRRALEHAQVDCDLDVIADGGAAMDFVREESSRANATIPDLVVLDLNLPKAHGREILAAMRASQKFADVRVVIWTSSNTPRDRDQLASLRIEQYIVKPAELDEFLKLGGVIKALIS